MAIGLPTPKADSVVSVPGSGFLKRLCALAICLSIIALGSADCRGGQEADQHYELGVTYENSLEIFQALDEFEEALALDPGNTGILEHYAWLLHAHQFREEAVEAFERLLQRETDRTAVSLGLAWNEMDLGRAARSIAFFNAAYGLNAPQEDVARAYLEIRARSSRENAANVAKLERTLAGDPADAAAAKQLFQLYVYQAAWDKAFPLGERLAADSRGDLPFRFAYYRGLLWAGRLTEAHAQLSSLMADLPENAYLHQELGRLLRAMNRPEDAEAALAASLALYPGAVKTRKELSELFARSGRAEEAIAMATEVVRDVGERLEAQLALARAYHFSGRRDEALTRYREILTRYPYNAEALAGLAECSLRAGDLSGAEEAVKRWEAAGPGDPGLKRIREEIASAAPALLVQADFFTNSSDYRRLNAGFAARLQPWGGVEPRLGYYYSEFRQEGFSDVGRHTFLLEGERRISASLSVEGRLGVNLYDNGQEHLTGRAGVRATLFPGSYLNVSYSRFDIIDTEPAFGNPLYNYVASIGAVGEKITTDDLSLYLQQMIGRDLRLWGSVAHGSYSDGNEKLTYVLGAEYRLLDAPHLRLRYSFFTLDYRDPAPTYREGDSQTAAYFDPGNFRVHTPGMELSFNLTPALALSVADDVSYVVTTSSVANSFALALTYAFTKEDSLRLDFRHVADVYRDEDDGDYSAEHFLVSFFHRF